MASFQVITTPDAVVIPSDHPTEVDVAAINTALARIDPGAAGAARQYVGHDGTTPVWRGERVFDIRHYGAVSGAADARAALVAADAAAAAAGGTVFVPEGTWTIPSAFVPSSNVTFAGAGYGSNLVYTGASGRCLDLTDRMFVRFRDLRITIAGANTTAISLSNSFKCSFTRMKLTGSNQPGALASYTERGIELVSNAGDNRFVDCDFDNLGEAIRTDSVQNYAVGCTFSSNRRGIVGGDPAGVQFRGGMSVTNTTFVGYDVISEDHIIVDGAGAEWWLAQVWFEKSERAITVGNGSGGCRSFTLRDAVVSARASCLDIQRAWQPVLDSITFGNEDGAATPVELTINATGAPTGTAANLRSAQVYDFADSVFPAGWFAVKRGAVKLPS